MTIITTKNGLNHLFRNEAGIFIMTSMPKVPSSAHKICRSVKYHALYPYLSEETVIIELALNTMTSPKPTNKNVRNNKRKSGVPRRVLFIGVQVLQSFFQIA